MNNVYVGCRYVPIFDGDWNNIKSYEPLTIVKYGNNSYTSKRPVPAGTLPTNETYWALTGNYNGQIIELNNKINDVISGMSILKSNECSIVGLNNVLNDGTDQSANLQAFIDYCAEHKVIAFISGDVYISAQISIPSNSFITGIGSIIGLNMENNRSLFYGNQVTDVTITNLDFNINGMNLSYEHGIRFDRSRRITIRDVTSHNSGTGSCGICLMWCIDCCLSGNICYNLSAGTYVANECENISVSDYVAYYCENGLDCFGCAHVSINNLNMHDNSNVSLNLDNTRYVTVSNVNSYSSKTLIGIYGGEYITVDNCNFINALTDSGVIIGRTSDLLDGQTDDFCKHIKINNCTIHRVPIAVNCMDATEGHLAEDIIISNCRMSSADNICCYIVGQRITFENNILEDLSVIGLRLACKIGKVTSNDITTSGSHCIEIIPAAAFATTRTVVANNVYANDTTNFISDNDNQCVVSDNYAA